jgi:hypothetical protein
MRRKRNLSVGKPEDSKRQKNERDTKDKRALRSMLINRQKEQVKELFFISYNHKTLILKVFKVFRYSY